MAENIFTRLTSPLTGLAGGTWTEMKKSPSFNPFSKTFGSLSKIKLGIGAIIVLIVVIAVAVVITKITVITAVLQGAQSDE